MKVLILAGGLGTRLGRMTSTKPKPMVKIGRIPILLHIIKYYFSYGYKEFYIALGYKGYVIRDYFKKYKDNRFSVKLIETGKNTMTGGRLKKFEKIFKNSDFMMTYGDGLSNINLKKLEKFHKKHGRTATITAVHPPGRFGSLSLLNNKVKSFDEKKQMNESWINGGFFVFNSKIFNYLKSNKTVLELEPLKKLAKKNQLMAYRHHDFWQCMDTLREQKFLNELWKKRPAWKKW